MAHVILGLLLVAPQSLYDLVKSFEAGVSLFYSASSGSIKRALDGLLADGRVEVAGAEGARGRKVYRVTDAGRTAFHDWMTGEPTGEVETAALSRLFFLGLLTAPERAPVLQRVTERMESELAGFERLAERLAQVEIPEHQRDLATYQIATLEYGIAGYRHATAHFRRLLEAETR